MRSKPEDLRELKVRLVLAAIVVVIMIILAGSKDSMVRGAASEGAAGERALITRVEPDPNTLRGVDAEGVVRVEALVAADGTVRAARLLEGNPVLGQASLKAIRQWKYAPAASEEVVTVKIEFANSSSQQTVVSNQR